VHHTLEAAVLNAHQSEAVTAAATGIAGSWGQGHHTAVIAEIAKLYDDLIRLPKEWSEQRRQSFVLDAADTTAGELITVLDDHIYQEADRPPVTEYGWTVHTEDRHDAVTATLTALTDEHLTWWLTDRLPELFAAENDTDQDHQTPAVKSSGQEAPMSALLAGDYLVNGVSGGFHR
jgi:hypothetical protein